jgi:hypothetical protein
MSCALPWAGGPRFADKFSGLLGEEQRFGGLSYPYYSTGNFRPCRKLNFLLTVLKRKKSRTSIAKPAVCVTQKIFEKKIRTGLKQARSVAEAEALIRAHTGF